ncbi:MAG: hypothetical protein SFX18_10905 [Pirellulales bacterium]|nr:hypothetical protein [Pirellulales bacterium]
MKTAITTTGTIFFLLALRIAIGWHFFSEGLHHVQDKNWSSKGFLSVSVGPFAESVKNQLPTHHRFAHTAGLPFAEGEKRPGVADRDYYVDALAHFNKPLDQKLQSYKADPKKPDQKLDDENHPLYKNPITGRWALQIMRDLKANTNAVSTHYQAGTISAEQVLQAEKARREKIAQLAASAKTPEKDKKPAENIPAASENKPADAIQSPVSDKPADATKPTENSEPAESGKPANSGKNETTSPPDATPSDATSPAKETDPPSDMPQDQSKSGDDAANKAAPESKDSIDDKPTEPSPENVEFQKATNSDKNTLEDNPADTDKSAAVDATAAVTLVKFQAGESTTKQPTITPAAAVTKTDSTPADAAAAATKSSEKNPTDPATTPPSDKIPSATDKGAKLTQADLFHQDLLTYMEFVKLRMQAWEQDIYEYRAELTRLEKMAAEPTAVVPFNDKRIADKRKELAAKPAAWWAEIEAIEKGLTARQIARLTDAQQAQFSKNPYLPPEPGYVKIDRVVKWVLLIAGACLVVGLFTRLAATVCGLFLLQVVLLNPFWEPLAVKATYYEWVELLACFTLATTLIGRVAGLDYILHGLIMGQSQGSPPTPAPARART